MLKLFFVNYLKCRAYAAAVGVYFENYIFGAVGGFSGANFLDTHEFLVNGQGPIL